MISHFIAVERRDAEGTLPERFQISFADTDGRAWFVWVPVNPTAPQLSQALMGAACIASDAVQAIRLGLITQDMLDRANAAVAQNRLTRAMTPAREM